MRFATKMMSVDDNLPFHFQFSLWDSYALSRWSLSSRSRFQFSLWDSWELGASDDDAMKRAFNSLYEILVYEEAYRWKQLYTFNSLYEIRRFMVGDRSAWRGGFQFSLWDSTPLRGLRRRQRGNFQFSLWDSCLWSPRQAVPKLSTFNSLYEILS